MYKKLQILYEHIEDLPLYQKSIDFEPKKLVLIISR